MARRAQKAANRPPAGRGRASAVAVPAAAWAVVAALVGMAVYLLWFLLVPVRLPDRPGELRRAEILRLVLLPEDVAGMWLGKQGEFALLDRLPVLGLALAMVGVAGLAGWLALVALRVEQRLPRSERAAFALGGGLSLTSLYTLSVGLAGWLQSRAVFVVPAAIVMAAAAIVAWRRRRERSVSPPHPNPLPEGEGTGGTSRRKSNLPPTWLERHGLWLMTPFALAIVLGGLLPPADFDVREYHLQAPKEFYQRGRIEFVPHNVYANMNLGAEVLALPAMALWGDWWHGALVGKTIIALLAPLGALAVYAAGRRLFSAPAGAIAAVVYLATPWIADVSTVGMVEGAVACYLALAVLAIAVWHDAGNAERGTRKAEQQEAAVEHTSSASNPRFVLVAGFFAGSAVACKYPAVLLVLLPLAAWIGIAAAGRRVRSLAIFLLAASLACGPWFVKNAVLAGNPTYPLLHSVFGGRTRSAEKDAQWTAAHLPRGYAADVAAYSLEDAAHRLVDLAGRSQWHSPLVVPLAALGLAAARWRRRAAPLAAYLLLFVAAWWLATHRIDRFWVPALPAAALLAGAGACWTTATLWRRGLAAVLGVGLVYAFLAVAGFDDVHHRYFVGLARLRVDPERVDPAHLYLNAQAATGDAVLLVGDAEAFDVEVPVYYNTVFDDDWFVTLVRGRSPDDVRRELARRHIRWVYVKWSEIARYRSQGNYGYPDFTRQAVFDDLVSAGVLHPRLTGDWQDYGDIYPVGPVRRAPNQSGSGRSSHRAPMNWGTTNLPQ